MFIKYGFMLLLNVVILEEHLVDANTSAGHNVYNSLFTNSSYNKDVRPVKDWNTVTVVNSSVSVIAIVEFDEVKQTIILTSKLILEWRDEYLVWDPSLYGNVSHIHTPQTKVWRPSIFLENSVAKQQEFGTASLKVVIQNDGLVTWEPVEVFHATCAADVRKFPFDTQKCSMIFEALGYTGNEMQLVAVVDHLDFHSYEGTSAWTVTETHMEVEIGESGKTHLLCSLTMRRNPTYFILNIFLPIVLLSFMNICVFILPVQSGEKASFVITVFLSLAVFLTIVSSNLPESSDTISLLNVYVFISTLLSVIIAILTIIQIRIYHKHENIPVPSLMKTIVIKFTSKKKYTSTGKKKLTTDAEEQNGDILKGNSTTRVVPFGTVDDTEKNGVTNHSDESENIFVTWPDVARAFDNMFLVIFLTVNIVMTTAIFTMALKNEEMIEEDHH